MSSDNSRDYFSGHFSRPNGQDFTLSDITKENTTNQYHLSQTQQIKALKRIITELQKSKQNVKNQKGRQSYVDQLKQQERDLRQNMKQLEMLREGLKQMVTNYEQLVQERDFLLAQHQADQNELQVLKKEKEALSQKQTATLNEVSSLSQKLEGESNKAQQIKKQAQQLKMEVICLRDSSHYFEKKYECAQCQLNSSENIRKQKENQFQVIFNNNILYLTEIKTLKKEVEMLRQSCSDSTSANPSLNVWTLNQIITKR